MTHFTFKAQHNISMLVKMHIFSFKLFHVESSFSGEVGDTQQKSPRRIWKSCVSWCLPGLVPPDWGASPYLAHSTLCKKRVRSKRSRDSLVVVSCIQKRERNLLLNSQKRRTDFLFQSSFEVFLKNALVFTIFSRINSGNGCWFFFDSRRKRLIVIFPDIYE